MGQELRLTPTRRKLHSISFTALPAPETSFLSLTTDTGRSGTTVTIVFFIETLDHRDVNCVYPGVLLPPSPVRFVVSGVQTEEMVYPPTRRSWGHPSYSPTVLKVPPQSWTDGPETSLPKPQL